MTPFLHPVNEKGDEFSGYTKIIKHPIDLETIEEKSRKTYYETFDQFH
jgi:hypothetical protein